jgi:H+-translocating NAD(P) transhydrogenase subunit beta
MSEPLINAIYIVAAALFVFGLKLLGSPATAVRGNRCRRSACSSPWWSRCSPSRSSSSSGSPSGVIVGSIIGAMAASGWP